MQDAAQVASEHRFPCDQCGADYRFDPANSRLICDHCGSEQPIAAKGPWTTAIRELDFASAIRNQLPQQDIEETRVSTCPNCAAQVDFDDDVHAKECPFCATPVVADTGIHRHIKPRALMPFALTEAQARDAMSDWLGRLWFAPNGLQEYARKGRKMQGVYVPYWTFDADTDTAYSGERGTIYYETVTVQRDGRSEQQRVARIRWTPVRGRVARWFDDVLVLASKSLPKRYTEALEPWDLSQLKPYSPEYIAGLNAEGYSIALEDGYKDARVKMQAVIERDVMMDIGGDRQRIHGMDTDVSNVTFKHILLRVWLAAYKYRGQTYRFVVNGATGRVQGERPWSAWKLAFAIAAGLLVAGAIGYGMATGQIK